MTNIPLGLITCGAVIVGLGVLWALRIYNKLVAVSVLLDEAWSGIDVQLKRRYDLIPNLVATVEGYGVHERSIFEQIAQSRAAAMGATTLDGKAQAEAGLTGALKTLFAVVENYPDLKAATNYLDLQKQLSVIEQDIQLSRRYYNGAARNYNMLVASFPPKLIASLFNFVARPYFEIGDAGHRESPHVSFKR